MEKIDCRQRNSEGLILTSLVLIRLVLLLRKQTALEHNTDFL